MQEPAHAIYMINLYIYMAGDEHFLKIEQKI